MRVAAAVGLGLLAAAPVRAADRAVHLQVPPPLTKDAAAMPQIAAPVDDAERRINTAVQRLDATARKAIAGCKLENGKPGDWERSVDVPMRGPRFLSFVVTDSVFCGGAHPDSSTMAIVYDLRTGSPVDWTRLLPPALTGEMTLQAGADGTKMVTLASKRLYALYRAGYPAAQSSDCKDAVQSSEPPAMMAWLDAKGGGLSVQFDLAHVVQACAEPVTIPLATLRAEGARPDLLDAFVPAQKGTPP